MKVWISKYALAGGIKERMAADRSGDDVSRVDGYMSFYSFKLGRDAHETREAAVKAAEAMRVKKIASLKKQIAKLEAMKFE